MLEKVREIALSLCLAFSFAFAFQSAAFATFYIPSESMVPTLQVGDRLTVSKFAYGWSRYSLPYDLDVPGNPKGRLLAADPKRGDIIVFIHPRTGERMIKRLIGMPGERIAVRNGRVIINGDVVPRKFVRKLKFREFEGGIVEVAEYDEILPGGKTHKVIHRTNPLISSDSRERKVPERHYFMMGDNRDNSSDSRFGHMGFVPADNLIGRAEAILYSWYNCEPEPGVECASARFATRLR